MTVVVEQKNLNKQIARFGNKTPVLEKAYLESPHGRVESYQLANKLLLDLETDKILFIQHMKTLQQQLELTYADKIEAEIELAKLKTIHHNEALNREALEEHRKRLNQRIDQLNDRIAAYELELELLNTQIELIDNKINQLTSQLNQAQRQLTQIQQQRQALQKAITTYGHANLKNMAPQVIQQQIAQLQLQLQLLPTGLQNNPQRLFLQQSIALLKNQLVVCQAYHVQLQPIQTTVTNNQLLITLPDGSQKPVHALLNYYTQDGKPCHNVKNAAMAVSIDKAIEKMANGVMEYHKMGYHEKTKQHQKHKAANKVYYLDEDNNITFDESRAKGCNYLSEDEIFVKDASGQNLVKDTRTNTVLDGIAHSIMTFKKNQSAHVCKTLMGSLNQAEQTVSDQIQQTATQLNSFKQQHSDLIDEREEKTMTMDSLASERSFYRTLTSNLSFFKPQPSMTSKHKSDKEEKYSPQW